MGGSVGLAPTRQPLPTLVRGLERRQSAYTSRRGDHRTPTSMQAKRYLGTSVHSYCARVNSILDYQLCTDPYKVFFSHACTEELTMMLPIRIRDRYITVYPHSKSTCPTWDLNPQPSDKTVRNLRGNDCDI